MRRISFVPKPGAPAFLADAVDLCGDEEIGIFDRLCAKRPQNSHKHLHLPWGALVAFARRNPDETRRHAERGSELARELFAFILAQDAREVLRSVRLQQSKYRA